MKFMDLKEFKKFKNLCVVGQSDLGKGRIGIWHRITNIYTGYV